MFALFGLSCTRFAVTICHALLKSLSVGALLAGMARYRRAYCDRRGKSFSWKFHHWSGSSSPSIVGNCMYRATSSEDSIFMSHHTSFVTTLTLFTLLNCSRACYLNSQFPSIIHVFSKLYRTIIAEKKEIKLSSSNFRYFRYAKNRISIFLKYRYLSKISIYRISLVPT